MCCDIETSLVVTVQYHTVFEWITFAVRWKDQGCRLQVYIVPNEFSPNLCKNENKSHLISNF